MLRIERLGKRLGGRWLFRAFSVELGKGDVLAVRGANGSGKSTLLRVLAGLMPADEGSIDRGPLETRLAVGYSALDLSVYGGLTAREHLELGRRLRGGPDGVPLLIESGLERALDQAVGSYSSGMRARLKLAMAAQHAPPILLLDEPTAALDDMGAAWVRTVVERQQEHGVTVFATNDSSDLAMSTHEVDLDG